MSGPEVTQPLQFGSHRSALVLTLPRFRSAPARTLALGHDEWGTLVTWVNANAPYYSTYYQYFDSKGKLLPRAKQVRVELDPPFRPGENRAGSSQREPSPGQPRTNPRAIAKPNTREFRM